MPELDKLVRLSELFGVTLDQLVKGETTADSARPEALPGADGRTTAISSARLAAGSVLLAVGALGLVLLLLFAGLEGADMVQLSVTRTRQAGDYHLMDAQNPVWLFSGEGRR